MNNKNDKIILFERVEDCCGCGACTAICGVNAIVMKRDKEGYDYPEIQEEICVKCKCCLKVCPIINSKI